MLKINFGFNLEKDINEGIISKCMAVENIIWLKDLDKNKVNLAGMKVAYLAEIYNNGFQVPNGFVISTDAFKEFLHSNNIGLEIKKILKNINHENSEEVSKAAEKIKTMILKEKISPVLEKDISEAYENLNVDEELLKVSGNVLSLIKRGRSGAIVAVRTSTISDIPGSCDNFLNIIGNKNLMNSVKECWSSFFNPGNILSMKKNNHEDSIAVFIQKMIDVNKSGVILSSNPMNREREIVIEASFGLGQLITKGEVTPDLYIIGNDFRPKRGVLGRKKLKLIRDVNTNETVKKKLLDEENIRVMQDWELEDAAKIAQKIERIYNKPVIVEFGIGKKITIFHARTFDLPEIIDKDILSGKILLEGRGASPKIKIGIVDKTVFVNDTADSRILENLDNLKGVVVNHGSLGSSFAIICRQHNIPFVIAENSTALLNHGLLVTVDGVNGKVYNGEAKEKEEKIKKVEIEIKTEEPESYGFEILGL